MSNYIRYFILVITLFISLSLSLANAQVSFQDLTQDEQARVQFLNDNNMPGTRLHIGGIKDGNKLVGPGQVNSGIESFQNGLVSQMKTLLAKNPQIESIEIKKTDFKGYYITCIPSQIADVSCNDIVSKYSAKEVTKEIALKSGDKSSSLNVLVASEDNFTKAYMKARFIDSFPDYKDSNGLDEFVKTKVKEVQDLAQANKIDIDQLKEVIATYRRDGIESVTDPNYKKAVTLLDSLEIPFATANNLEESLEKIIKTDSSSKTLANGMKISRALSGDDLYILLKDPSGKNIELIGADARGLGVTNMITRFEEITKPGTKVGGIGDTIALSLKAINRTDKIMFDSMNGYAEALGEAISKKITTQDINKLTKEELSLKLLEVLKQVNIDYNKTASTNSKLMNMRAARTDPSKIRGILDVREAMDLIGKLHNEAKDLEAMGVIKVITIDDLLDQNKDPNERIKKCLQRIVNKKQ